MSVSRRLGMTVALGIAAAFESAPASGFLRTADSIEWLCECMPHIGVVEVRLRGDVPHPSQARSLGLTIGRTTKVLKGKPPDQAAVRCSPGVRLKPGGRASLLAFFDEALQVMCAISLDDSESCADAITADFRVLRGRQAILAAAGDRLRRREPSVWQRGSHLDRSAPGMSFLTVPIPDWTPAAEQLERATFLNVPADSEYRAKLLRYLGSKYGSVRASSALFLGSYPGAETVAALRGLLTDPATDRAKIDERGLWVNAPYAYYPVRQAAYLALRKLGVDVPKPEGFVDDPAVESWIRANPANNQPTLFR